MGSENQYLTIISLIKRFLVILQVAKKWCVHGLVIYCFILSNRMSKVFLNFIGSVTRELLLNRIQIASAYISFTDSYKFCLLLSKSLKLLDEFYPYIYRIN